MGVGEKHPLGWGTDAGTGHLPVLSPANSPPARRQRWGSQREAVGHAWGRRESTAVGPSKRRGLQSSPVTEVLEEGVL